MHQYPSILALGIILLEISLGTTIKDKQRDEEKQEGRYVTSNTDCLVALRLFEEWLKESERSVSKAIPSGLKSAIEACLIPAKIPDTTPPPSDDQIRQYIFTDIVIPLGTALSTTYDIPLERLHEEISKERLAEEPDLFDSYDDKHTTDQYVHITNISLSIDCVQ